MKKEQVEHARQITYEKETLEIIQKKINDVSLHILNMHQKGLIVLKIENLLLKF